MVHFYVRGRTEFIAEIERITLISKRIMFDWYMKINCKTKNRPDTSI